MPCILFGAEGSVETVHNKTFLKPKLSLTVSSSGMKEVSWFYAASEGQYPSLENSGATVLKITSSQSSSHIRPKAFLAIDRTVDFTEQSL